MRTTYFSVVRPATLAAVAIIVLGTLSANAQTGVPAGSREKSATVINLPNRTLQRTTFQTVAGVGTSCSTAGCQVTAVAFTRPMACPVAAGQTCTLYLHLEGQALVSANDNGLFRFLVDGVAPNPGPTDPNGFYSWDDANPTSGVPNARSYSVTAKVKNTSKNQLHTIEVDIGCEDSTGDGCSAFLGFANLSTGVYTP